MKNSNGLEACNRIDIPNSAVYREDAERIPMGELGGAEAMNKRMNVLLSVAFLLASLCLAGTAAAQVTLEVMNPRGEIPPPTTLGLSTRVADLAGKKIVLVDNGKFGANNFLEVIAQMLKQKYPTATIVMYPKPAAQTITDMPKWYPTVAQQGDLYVFGVGD
jgi:hypothetical protein